MKNNGENQSVNKLRLFHNLKSNMQAFIEDSANLDVFSGFVEAYRDYVGQDKRLILDKSADALKKQAVQGVSLVHNGEKRLSNEVLADKFGAFGQFLSSSKLSFLKNEELLDNVSKTIEALAFESLNAKKIKDLKESIVKVGFKDDIVDFLKAASKLDVKQKKEVSQKKSENKELDKIRGFVMESAKSRLAKKAEKTPDEAYIDTHMDKISDVEIYKKDDKQYLKVLADDKYMLILFKVYKDKYVIGNTPEDLKNGSQVTKIYNVIAENGGSLSLNGAKANFGSPKLSVLKEKDLLERFELDSKSADLDQLKEEIKAYNTFMGAGKKADADTLLGKMEAKYNLLLQKIRLNGLEKKQEDLQKIIIQRSGNSEKLLQKGLESLTNNEILSLWVNGKNTNEKAKNFAEFLDIAVSKKNQESAKTQFMETAKKDYAMWKDVSENYYSEIKKQAGTNFYKLNAEKVFSNEMKVEDALTEANKFFPAELSKMIVTRSLEMHALAKNSVTEFDKMNQLQTKLGYKIRLQEFKVENKKPLRSKPLTSMLRCLADGRDFDFDSDEGKLDIRDKNYIKENYGEIKKVLGNEPNFQALIGDVIEGKKGRNAVMDLTPYQKSYKTLGILAALGSDVKLGKNKDDYLFETYMEVFFDKQIDVSETDKILKIKADYKWAEFKSNNGSRANIVAADFKNNSKNSDRLIASLVNTGAWASENGEPSVHHINPLKFAVCSANPAVFNDRSNLAVTVQWKAWENDDHQAEHLATIEGINAGNPYLVKEDGKYVRRAQVDLKEGMSVYYEKPQVRDKSGKFVDFISENTLYVSSSGLKVSSPEVPEIESTNSNIANKHNRDVSNYREGIKGHLVKSIVRKAFDEKDM